MNEIIKVDQAIAMSSREIAELTGKRHDNVMRTCRELKALGVTPQIEELDFNHKGNSYKEFKLNKRDSLVLVARLSPEFTGRIIDRWQELEEMHGRKHSLQWQKAREEGKLSRKAETDVIEAFIEYATAQGSQNARHYYVNLTKGTYKALYLLDKSADIKDLRERLSVMQLNQLSTAESVARKAIAEYMDMGTHYKDIYRIAIDRVITLADLLGKQLPGNDNVHGIKHKEAA